MNFRKTSTIFAVAALSLVMGVAQARAPEGNDDGIRNVVSTKGVSKSDSAITNAIALKVLQDDKNTNWIVKTSTKDGVVTLLGYVETEDLKQSVTNIAKSVSGVKAVDNKIVVGQIPVYKEPVSITIVTGEQEDAERASAPAK